MNVVSPHTLNGGRPIGCTEKQWAEARDGLERFVNEGWAAKAIELGWSEQELFHLPSNWHRIYETGAAWLIGRWLVVEVDAEAITVKPPWSTSQLKFRRSDELRQLVVTPVADTKPVLSGAELGLVDAIAGYMHVGDQANERVEVSATPARLLVALGQPPLPCDAAIARFMAIDDDLFERGLEMRFDGEHLVFGLHWKGCPRRFWQGRPAGQADQGHTPEPEAVPTVVDDEATAIACFKGAVEAVFGPGVEIIEGEEG
jgi:hypothetical protein